jgi:thermitase
VHAVAAALFLAGLMFGAIWPVRAGQEGQISSVGREPGAFEPGQLLVKFRAGVPVASAESAPGRYDAEHVKTLYGGGVQLWRVPVGDEVKISEQLSLDPRIEYAEPNYRVYAADSVPNDPSFGKQWAHSIMHSPAGWDLATGDGTVTIAILDTGIDRGHPDLQARIVGGRDWIDDDNDPRDLNGHGTHVAGIAAAVTNNGVGVAGMDWQARIMPIRVLDEEGNGSVAVLREGIEWAWEHGAHLLNLSLGLYVYSDTLQDAIVTAHNQGVLIVAAMGNDGVGDPFYPAAYEEVLAVAATGPTDVQTSYSNFGNHCDVAAPGGTDLAGIYSTMPTYPVWMTTQQSYVPGYDYVYGTSQATPYVTGLAALIWAQDRSLSAAEVESTIKATSKDLGAPGWDVNYGYGRVDALAALRVHSVPVAPVLAPISNADGDGTYVVDWNDVPYATSYLLQEADNPQFSAPEEHGNLLASQLQMAGRAAGIWYYRVRARNAYGAGPWSNSQMTVVRPEAPELSLVPDPSLPDEYLLTWSASNGATGYRLEEAGSESFVGPTTRYRGEALFYHVSGQPGGTWFYRVVAYHRAIEGLPSNVMSITVPEAALPPPELEPIDNEDRDGEYLVSWLGVGGALTYTLEESADPYFSAPVAIFAGPEQQTSVVGQAQGRWYYRVRAAGQAGRSPWSQTESTLVPDLAYLPLVFHNYVRPGLVNGGFEGGPVGWDQYSQSGLSLILNSTSLAPVPAHSGAWAARLGTDNDPISYIQQKFAVPEDLPFLHYWYWIDSADVCGFDVAKLRVNGNLVKLFYLCVSENTGRWVETAVNLGSYGGQTVTLQVRVETDSGLESNLFLDDFTFEENAPVVKQGRAPMAEAQSGR